MGYARAEIESIQSELRSIIGELDDISYGVRTKFKNIGQDKCANVINSVSENYKTVIRMLDTVDENKLEEGYTTN